MKTLCVAVFLSFVAGLCATADIQVTYTGYSAEQQAAFERAVNLWEPVLTSSVPIRINATQQNLPGFVIVVIPNLIRDFAAAPQTNLWYPTSLANMLSGTDLNPTEADIDVILNPGYNWYLGEEPTCPANQMDLCTEIHKAVTYGLGYMSSLYVSSGYGSYGMLDPSVLGLSTSFVWESMQGAPTQYDTHVLNTAGQYLCDTNSFANPSPQLAAQITGGQLRWHGTLADVYAGNTQPVLYAGSFNLARTARLSADAYNGTENAPGVPTAYNGTCYRYPAPIVLGILIDLGWDLDYATLTPAPEMLNGYAEYQNVILAWNPPPSEYNVLQYKIYRDDVLVGTANTTAFTETNVPWGDYNYNVTAVYTLGESPVSNTAVVLVGSPVDDPGNAPSATLLLGVAPNPFGERCTVDLAAKAGTPLWAGIYDLRGRRVAELYRGTATGQNIRLEWDGKDARGQNAPTGIYFIRALAGNAGEARKILKLR